MTNNYNEQKSELIYEIVRTRSYIRYSDHKQDDGYSVEYQISEIDEFCTKHGLELQKSHIDQAQSGTKVAGREEFFALINAVKDGAVDVIVVYKLNRLFRNSYESQKYRKLFRQHGVKLMSVTQQIDEETSSGRLTTNILSDIDQYQSETISDHVKSSMREMARQGYFTGGTVPFGYNLETIENGKKKRKKYIPAAAEAEVVRNVFQYYAENYSLRFIQSYLTENGHFTRRGKQFGLTSISRMLANDFYIGTLRYKTDGYDEIVTENAVPAIIDASLWHRVQERKKADKLVEPRKKKDLYSLTGKIFCGYCDAHFFGIKSGSVQNGKLYEYKYYVCSNRKNYRNCKCKQIQKDNIEQIILNELKKKILNDDCIKEISRTVSDLCEDSPTNISKEIKKLSRLKISLEKKIDNLLEMRLAGEMSPQILKRKSVVVEAELAEVTNKLFALNEQQRYSVTPESVEAYLRKMLNGISSADEEVLKVIFDNMVEKIIVTDTTADIHLIVRPRGKFEYNAPKGQPLYRLYSNVTL